MEDDIPPLFGRQTGLINRAPTVTQSLDSTFSSCPQVWGNLGLSRTQRRFNSMVQWSLFWLMTAFYFIPVGAVQ
eukprot:scaffold195367_cov21-Tisochrysis_lutea.AAC.5